MRLSNIIIGGLILNLNGTLWKLLVGAADKLHTVSQNVITGPRYVVCFTLLLFHNRNTNHTNRWPNSSSHLVPLEHPRTCGRHPSNGCLFNLSEDPGEYTSVSKSNEDLFYDMLSQVDEAQKHVYSPDRGKKDPNACKMAKERGGWWGPFVY